MQSPASASGTVLRTWIYDNDTEQEVMVAIDGLKGTRTLIIIAHRLTTIKNCDVIYEVKNGGLVKRKSDDIFHM